MSLVAEQPVRLAHVLQANVYPAAMQDGATLPDEIDSDSEGGGPPVLLPVK